MTDIMPTAFGLSRWTSRPSKRAALVAPPTDVLSPSIDTPFHVGALTP
jgi:hypothetical protein